MNRVLAAAAVLLLALSIQPAAAAGKTEPRGYLVYSVTTGTLQTLFGTSQSVHFRRIGEKKTRQNDFDNLWSKKDFDGGKVVVQALPPGDYEVTMIEVRIHPDIAKVELNAPFTIKEGQATYIGQLSPEIDYGLYRVPKKAGYTVADEMERDLGLARKLPAGTPAEKQILAW